MLGTTELLATLLQSGGGIIPRGTRVNVFGEIYWVFLVLGTLVGVVVISYMLYNAYKYRGEAEGADEYEEDVVRPQLGELPRGSGGGRKLFVSFAMSAIIVISLIAWTYGTLLFVEQGAAQQPPGEGEPLQVEVVGYRFGWQFTYPNGYTVDSTTGEPFRVPADRMVVLNVTSADVFHNIGIPQLRAKTDAIPGQYTDTWFIAEETGTYTARCYELCGARHSYMTAQVKVMEPDEWREWYESTTENATDGADNSTEALA